MSSESSESRFIVLSLPRCGSTTLTRLLNSHKNIRCLIEPFHPRRYGGKFNAFAVDQFSLDSALEIVWTRWNGIKHVWESSGWPFLERPELNDRVVLGADRNVVFIMRRNLLRRAISHHISRQTRYWMGSKAGFLRHLDDVKFRELDPEVMLAQIHADQQAVARYLDLLPKGNSRFTTLYYEDFFREGMASLERFQSVNSLLDFLRFEPITFETFAGEWERHFDPTLNRWASSEVYRRIPGIDDIEKEVGSDETGWLFR